MMVSMVSGSAIKNSEHGLFFLFMVLISTGALAQVADERAENIQQGLFSNFMSADQSYYKFNNVSDNDPYVYGYWVTAHALETLADAYQRTRNVVYYNRMKSIIAGIRKYNRYAAGTYRNDYYDDLEWLCLAAFNAYNATKDTEFLNAVHEIWAEIKTGYQGGVMSWKKGCTTPCNNSIGNSPAIVIAVKLYKLEHDAANLQMARGIHAWMKANVLNANGGIWDGPGNYDPGWQFSYNSGMFITASLELNQVTGQQSYLDDAIKACEFMMNFRKYKGDYQGGVFFLNETGQGDGGLFKGIFAKSFIDFVRMANLTPAQRERYLQVIHYTGDYAWNNAVNKSSYLISPDWSILPNGAIDVSTQVSGVHLFESIASLDKVHVYQDIDYAGFYAQLPAGNYTLAQLQERGVSDNDITSMTIPQGYTVTVYENDNFTGASKTFTANTAYLGDWNDKVSAVRISDVNGPVSVYHDENFGGPAAGLEAGYYVRAGLEAKGIANNAISSLKVAPGFKVTAYDGDNYTVASTSFTSDLTALDSWNDKITSLWVEDLRGPVTVFGEADLGGWGISLGEGVYTTVQLKTKGINDNDISSMKIAPGFAVTVYDGEPGTAPSATFTAEAGALEDWNDKISAVAITDVRGPVNVYGNAGFGGYAAGLDVGDYTLAQLQAKGIVNKDVSSLKIAQGFKVTVYENDNFTGATGDFTADAGELAGWNDRATSIRVRAAGDQTLSGIYRLQNRSSSLYMGVAGAAMGNGAGVEQQSLSEETSQLFLFEHVADGSYKITARHSGRALDADPALGKANGAAIRQWTYYGFANQQFIVVPTTDGYHKLIAKHNGRLVDAGTDIALFENTDQPSGMWKLTGPTAVQGNGDGLNATYYNGMNFEAQRFTRKDAAINFDWGNGSPNAAVSTDQFSARWTGYIQPGYNGAYTFYTIADDGVRLWVNNQMIVDKWRNDGGTEVTGEITLTAGEKYPIRLDYFENGGGARVKLEWSAAAQVREVVPTSQLYQALPPAVVGINETPETANTMAIYPNPGRHATTNELTIALTAPAKHVSLCMINNQGNIIMRGDHDVVDSKISVSIPPVSSGLYLIRVQDTYHTYTRKYVVK
jgi:predicted alpha-1,6-mannanase (GH76 family)